MPKRGWAALPVSGGIARGRTSRPSRAEPRRNLKPFSFSRVNLLRPVGRTVDRLRQRGWTDVDRGAGDRPVVEDLLFLQRDPDLAQDPHLVGSMELDTVG